MIRVVLMLADGFEETEALATADILRRAGLLVTLVSVTGKKEVAGSHDITIIADTLFEQTDFSDVEMVILPGGMPGAATLNAHEGLKQLITAVYSQGKRVGAICAAPMVLGQLGILKNKRATCYPGFEKYLTGAITLSDSVVVDGLVITARGAGVTIPFALQLVEELLGKEVSMETARRMMVP